MKRHLQTAAAIFAALAAVACSSQGSTGEPKDSITVNVAEKRAEIAPSMYGIFIEDINHGCDGGLVAEMIENKSFEDLEMPEGYYAEGDVLYTPFNYHHIKGKMVQTSYRWPSEPVPGWVIEGSGSMAMTKDDPFFESAPNSLRVSVDGQAVLVNDGFWGMNFQEGKNYEFRTIFKPFDGSVAVRLVGENGELLAESPVKADNEGEWNDVSFVLSPSGSTSKGSLAIALEGSGDVCFDYVSLMPEERYSYSGGKLPLRKDVADMLAAMKPSFVRWPGGCVVEGISISNRYEWKKSLGDPASRPGMYDCWGYHSSYGLGYHELLCFCESIGADALFVCNAGMGCEGRQGDICSDEDLQFFVDDCLDAIEYALGPVDSEWGAVRAAAGHPEPLPLKYIEVGNEDEGTVYETRYNVFHKAIKEKYPQLTVICNNGLFGKGAIEETDMIDPHWYVAPDFFFQNTHLFDTVERGSYKAYVGEYGVNTNVGSGAMIGALAEAAWIGGMERNSDLVRMTSVAPLLENVNDRFWPVNLIWVNSSQVLGRTSYYVQQMASVNRPDYNVACSAYENTTAAPQYVPGRITLGTNQTVSEFKELTVTTADGSANAIDLGSFISRKGDWSYSGGVLRQNAPLAEGTLCTFEGDFSGNYSIDLKFRRISGAEGCYIGFAMNEDATNGHRCSIGGWDDSITSIERILNGSGFNQGGMYKGGVVKEGEWQTIHLDIADGASVLYIDGEKITEHHVVTESITYYAAGYDERNSETVLKIVNRSGEVFPLAVTLDGASKVSRRGKVITLASENEMDENSFDDPLKIHPVETTWNGFGKNFTYDLQPYSYTILRIKTSIR